MEKLGPILGKIAWIMAIQLYLLAALVLPVKAELDLTPEEKAYISKGTIIKAASIDGGAPLHYIDSKGVIRGIAVRVLDEIAHLSGLIIEYRLYDSIEEVSASDPDLLFGLSSQYMPKGVVLSQIYLKSETILFYNSALDPNYLEDKKYVAIKGGRLPAGIEKEKTVFLNNREETLMAVERGLADYGYGNAYSVAFYTLQNTYKNITTVPLRKETREYGIGVPEQDDILLSIVNKSIAAIDESHMQSLILHEMSQVEKRLTFSAIAEAYGPAIARIVILIMGILLFSVVTSIRANNQLKLQNRRYELLSLISNECLFEYHVKSHHLELSDRCQQILDLPAKAEQVGELLRAALLDEGFEGSISTVKLPVPGEATGVFRMIISGDPADISKEDSIIGKLVDITAEVAEKERLISKSRLDGLTGLYNAITTQNLITEYMQNRNGSKVDALIFIDCDNFKEINDTHGHLTGNQTLESIGRGLKLTFRQTDIIGRIGGDEFLVYFKNIPSKNCIIAKCQQLEEQIKADHPNCGVSLSFGVAIPDNDSTYKELFKKADDALYTAKRKGGGQVVIHGETTSGSR